MNKKQILNMLDNLYNNIMCDLHNAYWGDDMTIFEKEYRELIHDIKNEVDKNE